ncbi:MAG: 30S ribosomal protein S27e [Thermoproteales archaeon]|nr:30S ribosomal protein S27e [Thermoproteales archaeon]RLE66217.1 MAG: 30S ribosomal protein S27e [Thermoprotei archaeon]
MRKFKILVPQPKSKFIKVRCPDCGNEQVIFNYAKIVTRCIVCGAVLAEPTGGKAKIKAILVKEYE